MSPGTGARRLIDGQEPAFADPFLVMAEDWMPRGAFPVHPHRGMETVTFVIEGSVEHSDSAGHGGVIHAGDAQWMTAGRGVRHEENAPEGTIAHTLQLWVNLPAAAKMTEPRYQDLAGSSMPVRLEPGVEVRVFSGRSGGVPRPRSTMCRSPCLTCGSSLARRFASFSRQRQRLRPCPRGRPKDRGRRDARSGQPARLADAVERARIVGTHAQVREHGRLAPDLCRPPLA